MNNPVEVTTISRREFLLTYINNPKPHIYYKNGQWNFIRRDLGDLATLANNIEALGYCMGMNRKLR